ncbi:MAG: PEP-CTERM sorting domain-containing protein [Chlorobia bacterium]|nr:PEP-CTERM sorting domain-containing protein [Fimbriimonadaceae bacterium]
MKKQIVALSCLCPLTSMAAFYDFEDRSAGTNAANVYPGLTITNGNATGTVSVGSTIFWAETLNGFQVSDNAALSWSGTKTLYTDSLVDTLIRFDTAVSNVSIQSDPGTPENPDIIRLIGMKAKANPGEFDVLVFNEIFDNGTTLGTTLLQFGIGTGVDYVLLQSTTENEAWDNLSTAAVPEPISLAALSAGIVCLIRRKSRS